MLEQKIKISALNIENEEVQLQIELTNGGKFNFN